MSKSPLPMVPVPAALETVLKEAANLLWCRHKNGSSSKGTLCSPRELVGRISAVDVRAPHPGYPNHNSSIMDGYAIKTSDLIGFRDDYNGNAQGNDQHEPSLDFVVVGKVYAGDEKPTAAFERNYRTAVYVTTGAVVPDGYDAVIPVEETVILENSHERPKMQIISSKVQSVLNTKPWTWIRTVGCDIPANYIVLSKGERIQPVHLALLTQVGLSLDDVRVNELIRIGILSTGNELTTGGSRGNAGVGKIPDVNRPLLLAQLSAYRNCETVDLGIVTDDEGRDVISKRLNDALWGQDGTYDESTRKSVDLLITTGGISMGEKDTIDDVFVQGMGGNVHFGRMNMKPGKPTTFITIDRKTRSGELLRKLIFALPGNPVSASVCTELLVRPCVDMMYYADINDFYDESVERKSCEKAYTEELERATFVRWAVENAFVHEEVMATLTSDVFLDRERPEYHRVSLERVPITDNQFAKNVNQQYTYKASSTGVQRSSRVLSLRNANGLMLLPRGGPLGCGFDVARKGTSFPVLLLSAFSESKSTRTLFKDSVHIKTTTIAELQHQPINGKINLGLLLCDSDNQSRLDDIMSEISQVSIRCLGGDARAVVLRKATISLLNEDSLTRQFSDIVNGPEMQGVDVIFVIVLTPHNFEEMGCSGIAFRAGLEVSHAVRPILAKSAHALALQVRKGAATQDGIAALFENVVGTVRDGTAVLVTCSDKGFENAVKSIGGSLRHVKAHILSQ
eukprot:CCRYP_015985-RA/>CCRYP_015985-RA protein AED:0.05 eAED:0.05 QI:0/0.5/0.33/1/1/1/3/530/738